MYFVFTMWFVVRLVFFSGPCVCMNHAPLWNIQILSLHFLCWSTSFVYLHFTVDYPSNTSSSSTDPSSTSSSSSSSSSSSTNQVISSVEQLLLALPTIIDPVGFGVQLGVEYNRCEQLTRSHASDINVQVRAIAAEWYNLTPCPTWNKVVEALYKHGLVRDAVNLASKVGVESPLPQEDGDRDHH